MVLTAAHVVGDWPWATVIPDGAPRRFSARVLSVDAARDIAVLQIADGGGALFASLTISKQPPRLGSEVAVLGYPLESLLAAEFSSGSISVSRGFVSSVRSELGGTSVIQTDAAVNTGNSGGPMIDLNGQIIGLVTSKIVGSSVEGLGFAVAAPHLSLAVAEAPLLGNQVPPAMTSIEGARELTNPGFCPARGGARTFPPFPAFVSGNVTIAGEPAPAGLEVVARVATTRFGECWTSAAFTADNGSYFLAVGLPDATDLWFPIDVLVQGVVAGTILEEGFRFGGSIALNLDVS